MLYLYLSYLLLIYLIDLEIKSLMSTKTKTETKDETIEETIVTPNNLNVYNSVNFPGKFVFNSGNDLYNTSGDLSPLPPLLATLIYQVPPGKKGYLYGLSIYFSNPLASSISFIVDVYDKDDVFLYRTNFGNTSSIAGPIITTIPIFVKEEQKVFVATSSNNPGGKFYTFGMEFDESVPFDRQVTFIDTPVGVPFSVLDPPADTTTTTRKIVSSNLQGNLHANQINYAVAFPSIQTLTARYLQQIPNHANAFVRSNSLAINPQPQAFVRTASYFNMSATITRLSGSGTVYFITDFFDESITA